MNSFRSRCAASLCALLLLPGGASYAAVSPTARPGVHGPFLVEVLTATVVNADRPLLSSHVRSTEVRTLEALASGPGSAGRNLPSVLRRLLDERRPTGQPLGEFLLTRFRAFLTLYPMADPHYALLQELGAAAGAAQDLQQRFDSWLANAAEDPEFPAGIWLSRVVRGHLRLTSTLSEQRNEAISGNVVLWCAANNLPYRRPHIGGRYQTFFELNLANGPKVVIEAEGVYHASADPDVDAMNMVVDRRKTGQLHFAVLLEDRDDLGRSALVHEVWEVGLRALGYPPAKAHDLALRFVHQKKPLTFLLNYPRHKEPAFIPGPSASVPNPLSALVKVETTWKAPKTGPLAEKIQIHRNELDFRGNFQIGTGVVIYQTAESLYVITAAHVTNPLYLDTADEKAEALHQVRVISRGGYEAVAEVIAESRRYLLEDLVSDFALLRVPRHDLNSSDIVALPLGHATDIEHLGGSDGSVALKGLDAKRAMFKEYPGHIVPGEASHPEGILRVYMPFIPPGFSGGAVAAGNKLLGLILSHHTTLVGDGVGLTLHIDRIHAILRELLSRTARARWIVSFSRRDRVALRAALRQAV